MSENENNIYIIKWPDDVDTYIELEQRLYNEYKEAGRLEDLPYFGSDSGINLLYFKWIGDIMDILRHNSSELLIVIDNKAFARSKLSLEEFKQLELPPNGGIYEPSEEERELLNVELKKKNKNI